MIPHNTNTYATQVRVYPSVTTKWSHPYIYIYTYRPQTHHSRTYIPLQDISKQTHSHSHTYTMPSNCATEASQSSHIICIRRGHVHTQTSDHPQCARISRVSHNRIHMLYPLFIFISEHIQSTQSQLVEYLFFSYNPHGLFATGF